MDRHASWVAEAVSGRLVGPDVEVTGPVVTDSREALPGSLYVARRGETTDGHAFTRAAAEAGAVCALVEHPVDGADLTQVVVGDSTRALGDLAHAHLEDLRSRTGITVVAITGSVGKTTTKDLLAQVLAAHAPTVAPLRSFNNEVGTPLTVLRADLSTRYLVLEMGASAPGNLTYLTGIAAPDVAVELRVGSAHLGGFGSREGLARAKVELVDGEVPGATTVLNADDDLVSAMGSHAKGPVVRFSVDEGVPADVHALDISVDADDHPSFTLVTGEGRAHVDLGLVGAHHVHNALAAATVCRVLGLGTADIAESLSGATALSPHRMAVSEVRVDGHPVTVIDDAYNANPDSVRAALEALASLAHGRRTVAVLGEMLELGDTSPALHRQVGEFAASLGTDVVVAVGQGAGALLEPLAGHAVTEHAATAEEATALVRGVLHDGDVVLVKGSNDSGVWRTADALTGQGDPQ
ncbi:UDP-N-acetylmuramoyl-tripeptide--D-alanyl-D-alanine ligase [Actinomyces sp.]|uniref:UDP-N-acetylmuramoyl-tripeptide--D-alanyl-D- alanine ligase n=1 Tax=Actinomyces sp. TaxID=29317 RepID=UPI002897DDA0|nr:UDP-N-acetylmuramoyl-tripeptide--D-alanyl-D-alanine ligase [Actinomyces sp.]